MRRLVAERMELIDDDRSDAMVSITGVDVDRDLYRAVVWFTSLDDDHDPEIAEAFEEHGGKDAPPCSYPVEAAARTDT